MAKKDENASAGTTGATGAAGVKPAKRRRTRRKVRRLPPYHVILLDDDDHSYAYVIEMLGDIFTYDVDKALGMAEEVDASGRVIVLTTHKELAELKRDQILGYGADPRDKNCRGSMRAVIEPAPE